MSTAFYPLGMQTYNNNLPQGGYVSWKGSGTSSNPIGIASSNIRPLTNNDPGNVFTTGFGLPRPIKHYRKGRVIPGPQLTQYENNASIPQIPLINYNMNRIVQSSRSGSLGGGGGGNGLLNQIIGTPGMYSIKPNSLDETNNVEEYTKDCKTCQGVAVISNIYPNPLYITNNPNQATTTQPLCCNIPKKALKRVLAPKTILSKNYYTTTKQYLQNRCQTYIQRSFNFQTNANPSPSNSGNIPGTPEALNNAYYANCFPNFDIMETTEISLINKFMNILLNSGLITQEQLNAFFASNITTISGLQAYLENVINNQNAMNLFISFVNNPYYGIPISGPSNPNGCKLVYYKPSNPQFATEGAVSQGTKILKLNVDTINTNLASLNKTDTYASQAVTELTNGIIPSVIPIILKNKAPNCNPGLHTKIGNKTSCPFNIQNSKYPANWTSQMTNVNNTIENNLS